MSTTDDSELLDFPSGGDGDSMLGERERVAAALFGHRSEPRTIGRYRVDEELGRGAMGVVYEAWDEVLQRTVAVKLISRDAEIGRAEHRFRREALALAKLDHPNVVGVHEVGMHDGRLFIAMELVRGQTLDAWLASEPRTWEAVLRVFVQAGRGLQAAHDAGLVHRDFKPANCIVGQSGWVRVLDFGLARGATDLLDEEAAATFPRVNSLDVSVTRTGATLGTPAYMAPEQLRGLEVSPSSDQFSFAIALYEGLEGVRPFAGSCIVDIHQNIEAGRRQAGSGRTPKAVLQIVERGLALSPSERWPSVGAMLDALEALPERRARRRRTWWMGGMGVIAVSALGFAAIPSDPCGDLPRSRVWPQARRSAIEASMGSDPTWRTLDAAVSRWTEAWSETYEGVCRAAREESRSTEAALARQWACLDRRERTVDALIEGLAESSAPAMHGGDVVRSLPSLEDCGALEVVQAVEPPPPAAASDVATVRRLLDESLVASTVGDLEQAVALADAARRLADEVRYAPARVEAGLRRGELAMHVDGDGGRSVLAETFVLAEATHYDAAAADAALRASKVAVERDDLDEARRWGELAAAKLERIAAGPLRRTHLASVQTQLALLEGDLEAAGEASRALMKLCVEAAGEASLVCADALALRARVVEVTGSPRETERAYSDAIEALGSLVGPDHPAVAVGRLNRGLFRMEAGRLDAAAEDFDRSHRVLEVAGLPRLQIQVELARVQLASLRGDLDVSALEPVERLLGPYPPDDPQRLEYEGVLAGFLLRLGEPRRALDLFMRLSAEHQRTLGPSHPMASMDLSNIGECLIALERWDEAETYFQTALAQLESSVPATDELLAYPLTGLGRVRLAQGQLEVARGLLERSLGLGPADPLLLGQTQWALARGLGLESERGASLAIESREHFLAASDEVSAEDVTNALRKGRSTDRDED